MTKFSRTVDYYGSEYQVNKSGNIDCGKTMLPDCEYELTATSPHHRVHRIIAKAFPEICGVWFEGCHVHHINGNKLDNRARNLVILTPEAHKAIHYNLKYGSNTEFEDKFCKRYLKVHIRRMKEYRNSMPSYIDYIYETMFWYILAILYYHNGKVHYDFLVNNFSTYTKITDKDWIMHYIIELIYKHFGTGNLFCFEKETIELVPALCENLNRISISLMKGLKKYFIENFKLKQDKCYKCYESWLEEIKNINADRIFEDIKNAF